MFLTLLIPLKAGESSPVRDVHKEGQAYSVSLADGRRLVISVGDTGERLQVNEILATGNTGRSFTTL